MERCKIFYLVTICVLVLGTVIGVLFSYHAGYEASQSTIKVDNEMSQPQQESNNSDNETSKPQQESNNMVIPDFGEELGETYFVSGSHDVDIISKETAAELDEYFASTYVFKNKQAMIDKPVAAAAIAYGLERASGTNMKEIYFDVRQPADKTRYYVYCFEVENTTVGGALVYIINKQDGKVFGVYLGE